jgi:hypothetical protein
MMATLCATMSVAWGDELHIHGPLHGHGNLIAAEQAMFHSFEHITKSQEANECVWGIEGGHGQKAKDAIDKARHQVWDAAEWVNTHDKECTRFTPGVNLKGQPRLKGHGELRGHPQLVAAEVDLIDAWDAITRSQEANECVFGIEGGHGAKAKAEIDRAFHQVYDAAEYVNTHPRLCHPRPW